LNVRPTERPTDINFGILAASDANAHSTLTCGLEVLEEAFDAGAQSRGVEALGALVVGGGAVTPQLEFLHAKGEETVRAGARSSRDITAADVPTR